MGKSFFDGPIYWRISTTSRIKSFNAILKKYLVSTSSLQKVLLAFWKIEEEQIEKYQEEFMGDLSCDLNEVKLLKRYQKRVSQLRIQKNLTSL